MSLADTVEPAPQTANPRERLPRLARLVLKELREILRDRRTIITLVLMPLLLYPLLTVAFQQFFLSQLGQVEAPRYTLGFENRRQARFLLQMLALGGLKTVEINEKVPLEMQDGEPRPVVESAIYRNLDAGLAKWDIDVGLRLTGNPPPAGSEADVAGDIELVLREDSLRSRQAAQYIEKFLGVANERLLQSRLRSLGAPQRALTRVRRYVEQKETAAGTGGVSITAVIPFVLILMTLTGAVYPAIDLTAGERERGTLEVLVAAPIPRMGVLFAKYVAVLTVSVLTAAANLVMMTVTMQVSGLANRLFGAAGISPGIMAAIFGLLLLFAAFFSAVLLVITSCARSFKEAQAYLIPLIIVSLAPGILSLMPGLELSGLLLVTPLANMVLLGRDLFALKASGPVVLTVVVSTLIYAGAAIGLAARIFGSESVLYASQSGWSDLFRRSRERHAAPSLTAAAVCLALMIPAYFILMNLLGRTGDVRSALQGGVTMTVFVFGILPLAACWMQRVRVAPAFALPVNSAAVFAGALCVGLSMWVLALEVTVFSKNIRDVTLDPRLVEKVQQLAASWRALPVWGVLLAMAVVPALFEEWFFRGFLYAALRRAASAPTAVVTSAVTFGLFHGISPLPSERVLSSTLVGLMLGWIRWRTGSILPGLVVHLCHNGFVIAMAYYEPQLKNLQLGIGEGDHLPPVYVAGAAVLTAVGLAIVWRFGRRSEAEAALAPHGRQSVPRAASVA